MGLGDDLEKETERLIIVAQDQAFRTNGLKAKIKTRPVTPLCRMCNVKDETVGHLLCVNLSKWQHKHRHVARIVRTQGNRETTWTGC